MAYCVKCAGTGIDIDGNPCTCRVNVQSFYDSISCLDIPEQYRGTRFNKMLVPNDIDESYPEFLQSIYDKVTSGNWRCKNLIIASPIGHSKTILAYACIEVLFRNGISTFPVYDIFELKKALLDFDLGKKSSTDIENPELIVSVPILFVKIPRVTTWETYDIIALILDRRVRRGNATIYLYDGSWSELVYSDKRHVLAGLQGDGLFNTLECKSWSANTPEEKHIIIEDNLG